MLSIYSAQAIREVPPLSEHGRDGPPVAAAFWSLQRENGEKKNCIKREAGVNLDQIPDVTTVNLKLIDIYLFADITVFRQTELMFMTRIRTGKSLGP